MRRIPAKVLSPFLQYFVKHYFKKPRTYRYKGLKTVVFPGVFFPHFTLSTKLLLQFLENEKLANLRFLELGCGTAIISCFAAKKGANVVASDINEIAINNAIFNAEKNKVNIKSVQSDLFDNLHDYHFDYIVINPPYYPKTPKDNVEKAWFCGENFEYFEKLFSQLTELYHSKMKIIMILSEDCEIEKISEIGNNNKLELKVIKQQYKYGEKNYIFELSPI